jgi:8-oxo-dGTP pyrophosphatase MutT (NUDIX family)
VWGGRVGPGAPTCGAHSCGVALSAVGVAGRSRARRVCRPAAPTHRRPTSPVPRAHTVVRVCDPSSSGSRPVTVKAVCLTQDGRVLLCRNHRGEWELPGGRPDPGEPFRDCAVREVREETDWTSPSPSPGSSASSHSRSRRERGSTSWPTTAFSPPVRRRRRCTPAANTRGSPSLTYPPCPTPSSRRHTGTSSLSADSGRRRNRGRRVPR